MSGRWVPVDIKAEVSKMIGLPWERLKWLGQGSYADAWELPAPWKAVVRISYERYEPEWTISTARKMLAANHTKHLPRVFAAELFKSSEGGYYCVIIMKRYRRYSQESREGDSRDDFHKVQDKIYEEMRRLDLPFSDDTHQYNIGYDDDNTPVYYDIW